MKTLILSAVLFFLCGFLQAEEISIRDSAIVRAGLPVELQDGSDTTFENNTIVTVESFKTEAGEEWAHFYIQHHGKNVEGSVRRKNLVPMYNNEERRRATLAALYPSAAAPEPPVINKVTVVNNQTEGRIEGVILIEGSPPQSARQFPTRIVAYHVTPAYMTTGGLRKIVPEQVKEIAFTNPSESGAYSLCLEPGSYRVVIEIPRYGIINPHKETRNLTLEAGKTLTFSVNFKRN